MGALPQGLLVSVCVVLLAAVLAHATEPETASMVVGLAKCADCTAKNKKAEAVLKGLHVAIKCKNAKGEFETKAMAKVEKSGAFSVPLAAELLRQDGELKQNCFAQLHSASHQPCPGQTPSWIVRPSSSDEGKKTTFVAVAGKMHYSSKECTSAFLFDPFHKKPIVIPHEHKKPIVNPHIHKKPIELPHPDIHKKPIEIPHPDIHKKPIEIPHPDIHKKPIEIPHLDIHKKPIELPHPHPDIHKKPVPEYSHPTPVPTYKPPTPEYSHPSPTPIYHPPADQKTQNPETDPEMFKKLLPFIKKKPFFFPKFKKFPPAKEEVKA